MVKEMNEFRSLFEARGWRVISSWYDEKMFGNFEIELMKGGLLATVCNDRGVKHVEVSARHDRSNRYDLGLIRALLTLDELTLTEALPIDEEADYLEDRLSEIGTLFSVENYDATVTKLRSLRAVRVKLLFPNAYG